MANNERVLNGIVNVVGFGTVIGAGLLTIASYMQAQDKTKRKFMEAVSQNIEYASPVEPTPVVQSAPSQSNALENKVSDEFPQFRWINNETISYSDNFAPGSKAFLVDRDFNVKELTKSSAYQDRATFAFPKDVLTNHDYSTFHTFAIDRNNNASEINRFYVVDGVVVDSLPADLQNSEEYK